MRLLLLLLTGSAFLLASTQPVIWTMINVNAGFLQGDAHLLEMPSGKRILIDACGNNEALLHFLKEKKIEILDQVLISHLHKDHYGGLLQLIENGVKVSSLRMTVPSEKTCKAEVPWGCDWQDIQNFKNRLRELKIPVNGYKANEVLLLEADKRLEVLAAYPSHPTPVGEVDVNDTSAILKLTHGRMSVLFTGDLNGKLGNWLSENHTNLRSDILKVPHHGTESTAPNSFFDAVEAKFALIPSPRALWLSERSSRVRNYFNHKKTIAYVNGLNGNIQVRLNSESFTIEPEFKSPQKAIYYVKSLSE